MKNKKIKKEFKKLKQELTAIREVIIVLNEAIRITKLDLQTEMQQNYMGLAEDMQDLFEICRPKFQETPPRKKQSPYYTEPNSPITIPTPQPTPITMPEPIKIWYGTPYTPVSSTNLKGK